MAGSRRLVSAESLPQTENPGLPSWPSRIRHPYTPRPSACATSVSSPIPEAPRTVSGVASGQIDRKRPGLWDISRRAGCYSLTADEDAAAVGRPDIGLRCHSASLPVAVARLGLQIFQNRPIYAASRMSQLPGRGHYFDRAAAGSDPSRWCALWNSRR